MDQETILYLLFIVFGIALIVIRIYYQRTTDHETEGANKRAPSSPALSSRAAFGALAALTSLFFGGVFILVPNAFPWSYLGLPLWTRWVGVGMLTVGVSLLWTANHHLGITYDSFVAFRTGQKMIDSGPYRVIRHPIYTAYLLNYIGLGLLASSWVLLGVPFLAFSIMVALRVGEEEQALVENFGEEYVEYKGRTGRFSPWT